MFKYKNLTSALFLFFTVSISVIAQDTTEEDNLSLDSGTLDNQFEYVIQKSSNWRDDRGNTYEVIKRDWLNKLKSHTLDSLKAVKSELLNTQKTVTTQKEEIDQLKTNLSTTKTNLEATNEEKDSMSLFGIAMSKSGYNVLMWSIIAGLLAFLLFFIFRFKNSNAITKEAKQKLTEVEEEFEEHRRNALEREQKVRRQLQDELNKNRNS
ncbi:MULTISPECIES: tRNA (guanine-N1)-methyltransferase [Mesoflavibacter]|uniref:tRNA (Guanine-N1)-methyltransferase n=1 Tax=Mesoflavibacter profundi TaxID=2708110 RepID=A0ABT4RYK7_9FLAO|nr:MULTISPECIES: tRNA (guanine-N1)-methyltransferase [Mesoflavibacter]MDA0176906.1 tRNA (guanine-N1)-methyltransferase [Mesoflavibacter profundi]QIJ87821.1 hypothetical protein C7H62_0011 [Mesoflavibacter sp. HG96]QIJ90549.1 hypothetical protein C7H56_0011 [Mesoflavibacter sp. HG37]